MTITATLLDADVDSTDATSYTTASVSPTSGATVYAFYHPRRASAAQPTTPTVSGAGLTWTEVAGSAAYFDATGTTSKLLVFEGTGTASTGAITFDHDSTTHTAAGWIVVECDGDAGDVQVAETETSGTTDDAVTSRTLTFSGTPAGSVLTCAATNSSGAAPTPGEGYGTAVGDGGSSAGGYNSAMLAYFDQAGADSTVDWTWAGPNKGGCIAVELEEVAGTVTVDADLLAPTGLPQPSVTAGAVTVTVGLLQAATVAQPQVSTGALTVTADLLSAATLQQPAVTKLGVLDRPVVGGVRSTSAMVNALLIDATSAVLKVATDAALTTNVTTSGSESPDSNGYVSFTVTGLTAATDYHFGVEVDGQTSDAALRGTFTTLPTVGTAASFTFAHSACINNPADAALGDTLDEIRTQRDPLFFALLGDSPYGDISSDTLTDYLDDYETLLDDSNVAEFARSIPIEYRWSDHDFLGNNVQGEESGTTQSRRAVRSEAARDVFPLRDLGDATSNGAIYRSMQVGRVLFVFADERYYAINEANTDNSSKWKWGSDQRDWFEALLASTSAKLVVVFHDTVWKRAAAAGNDSWGGFTNERTLIDDLITAAGKPVIHIGADMHAVAATDTGLDYTTAQAGTESRMALQAGALEQTGSTEGGPWTLVQRDPDATSQISSGDSRYGLGSVTDDGTTITFSWEGRQATSASASTVVVPTDASPATFSVTFVDGDLLSPAALPSPSVAQVASADLLSAAAVPQPAVASGAVTVTANLLSAATCEQPAVTAGTVTVTVDGLSAASVLSPTVSTGASVITGNLLSPATLPQPVVAPGAVTVTVGLLQAATVAQPQVSTGALTVTADLLSAATLQTPTAAPGAVTVDADLLAPTGLPQPAVTAGTATATADLLAAATVTQPTVTVGGVTVTSNLLQTPGPLQPTVTQGTVASAPVLAATGLPQPAVVAAQSAAAELLSPAALPQPAATPGAVTIEPDLLQAATVEQPAAATGVTSVAAQLLAPTGLPQPAVAVGAATADADLLQATTVPQPAVAAGTVTVTVATLAPAAVEQPAVAQGGPVAVANTLAPAALPAPTVTPGPVTATANALAPAALPQPAAAVGAATLTANPLAPAALPQPATTTGTVTATANLLAAAAAYQPAVAVGELGVRVGRGRVQTTPPNRVAVATPNRVEIGV